MTTHLKVCRLLGTDVGTEIVHLKSAVKWGYYQQRNIVKLGLIGYHKTVKTKRNVVRM